MLLLEDNQVILVHAFVGFREARYKPNLKVHSF